MRHQLAIITAVGLLAITGAMAPEAGAVGVTGGVHNLSSPAEMLSVRIDARWLEGLGYRPVEITVTPMAGAVNDRRLTVEFLVRRNWQGRGPDLLVREIVDVPAGGAPVTTTMSVPQITYWQSDSIRVLDEDGRPIKKLCVGWTPVGSRTDEYYEDELPNVLMAEYSGGTRLQTGTSSGIAVPKSSQLLEALANDDPADFAAARVVANLRSIKDSTGPPITVPTTPLPTLLTKRPADFPRRWLDYTSLDIVCLSIDQLDNLATGNPETFDAMLQWVSAGGSLWVYGVGQQWQNLQRLEKRLAMKPVDESLPKEFGWTEPKASDFPKQLRRISVTERYYPTVSDMEDEEAVEVVPPEAPEQSPFKLRQFDMGLVVAMAEKDPFPGEAAGWRWLLNAMGASRWQGEVRHGVSMCSDNSDFWDWLIPGVGLAPAMEFCVLITLFALAIGPLNYWLLRRWRRLHLLVVTIPLGAAAVTFTLFAWAILSDGLGTRLRARSVTHIDQSRGQAACWSRLSFYSGLAPFGGLTFPGDVEVLPIDPLPDDYNEYQAKGKILSWEDGSQRMTHGWLPSRTPTQYATVRSRPSGLGLEITGRQAGSAALEVKNNLGVNTTILHLAVCDTDGKHYWGTDVQPRGTATLEPLALNEIGRRLRDVHRSNRPAVPRGMDPDSYGGGIFGSPAYRYRWMYGDRFGDVTQRTGRMEMTLSQLAVPDSPDYTLRVPGSYIAIVDKSPEVEPGTTSAVEEESYHVIIGRW